MHGSLKNAGTTTTNERTVRRSHFSLARAINDVGIGGYLTKVYGNQSVIAVVEP